MMEPAFGDKVLVRPREGMKVQEHGNIFGRFMAPEWHERVWDDWLHRRYVTGEVEILPPPADRDDSDDSVKPHSFQIKGKE